jgi:hypothetical protein
MCQMGVQMCHLGGPKCVSGGSKMCHSGGGSQMGSKCAKMSQNVLLGVQIRGGDPLWGKSGAGMVHLGGSQRSDLDQNRVENVKK